MMILEMGFVEVQTVAAAAAAAADVTAVDDE